MNDRGDLARPDDVASDPPVPHGNVGPDDPHADPVTDPAMPVPDPDARERSVVSGFYVGLIIAALVLIFLLVFILQNNVPVQINFLGFSGTLPTGVALLLAAIAGVLLVVIPGSARLVQLRRAARRTNRKR